MLVQARVNFSRPKHKIRMNDGYTSVDMHYHTKYSDGTRKITSIAKKAKRLNIGVSITDHNEIRGALEINKYKEVLSIPGIETTSKEGIHTLFYFYSTSELSEFYNHNILPNKKRGLHFLDINFKDLFDMSKDYNCIVSAAHPYGLSWTGICSQMHKNLISTNDIKKFDALEVVNGAALRKMNTDALFLAQSLNKPITGGSDGHRLFELGNVLTYVKDPVDRISFLESIKKHKTFIEGKETNVVEMIATHSTKITVPVKHPITYMKKGYDYTKSLINTRI